MYLNKVTLIGNLTRDPEIKALPSGVKVAQIGLATNRTWKDANGAKQEATEYHNLVSFGRQAEILAQYCHKGDSLYIEGRLQTRSWDDASGQKKYRTEILIEEFQFGQKSGGGDRSSYGSSSAATPSNASEDSTAFGSAPSAPSYPTDDISLDDIPF
jgi:single-strand DNA-binding protein